MKHFDIYNKRGHYASFPSLAVDKDGILYCAFRLVKSPKNKTHIDTSATTIVMRSRNNGKDWQRISKLSLSRFTGNQDPALTICKDGFYLTCYGWAGKKKTRNPEQVQLIGLELFKSDDSGYTWVNKGALSKPFSGLRIATRSHFVEVNKTMLLAGYANLGGGGDACLCLEYIGDGFGWRNHFKKIAHDPSGDLNFQEPVLLVCESQHLLCLMRVHWSDGTRIYQAHSWDGGASWQPPRDTGIRGLPPDLLRLDDGRILCTYGYRRPPFGIRACVSYDEGLTWNLFNDVAIRTDGGGWDIGYPKTIQLPSGELFTTYYFYTKDNKTSRIMGTRWEL
jgi:hypothetical protein